MLILSITDAIVNIVMEFLRNISFFFDGVVYGVIGKVYNLLMEIAQTSVFTDDIIDTFAGRIYALLGIFMLFKVSFSILTYIVSPDDFLDKNKGFAKLISNILITLTLLVATPWIFSQAMDFQRIVLRDNVIGKIFIGVGNETDTVFDQNSAGLLMSYETYKAFYYIDTDNSNLAGCKDKIAGNSTTKNCELEADFISILQASETSKSVDVYRDNDLFNAKTNDDRYVMNYTPFLSVIVGVVVLLLLVVFCFDIAVRSIKLGFLRMLAPIPIVSRIDPKKGKEVFDKWFKSVISTYLDLFVRLIAIYFAIFIISTITQDLGVVDPVTGTKSSPSGFVIVFIILGALLFAKQLPKLIEEIAGFKMDGKFTLNPLKKLGSVPVAGVAGGAMAAGGAIGVGAMLAGGRGVANVIGGGAKMATGKALNKVSGGAFGSGLVGSGRTTLIGTKEAMGKRMSASMTEARGRLSAASFKGDSEYKGDTAGKILAKEKEKMRSDITSGKNAFRAYNRQWLRGDQIQQSLSQSFGVSKDKAFDMFDGQDSRAYSAVYKSQAFRDSLMRLDAADSKLKEIKKEYDVAYSTGTLTAELQEKYEKQAKTVKGLESVHDTMRKTYADDAQTQDAIKFRKYNSSNPTGK